MASYEDFVRSDGSWDNDKWLTATNLKRGDYDRIMKERGFLRDKNNASRYSGPAPVKRLDALFNEAPKAETMADLAKGSSATPVDAGRAEENLSALRSAPQEDIEVVADGGQIHVTPDGSYTQTGKVRSQKFGPTEQLEKDDAPPEVSTWDRIKKELGDTVDYAGTLPGKLADALSGTDKEEEPRSPASPTIDGSKIEDVKAGLGIKVPPRRSSKPLAVVEKFRESRGEAPAKQVTESADSPAPESTGVASARSPLVAAQQLVTGAKPPDTADEEAELAEAIKARDADALSAQLASQFGHYADIQAGTSTGDRGAVLRGQSGRHLEDLKAKRAIREDAAAKASAAEEQRYDRQGTDLQRAGLIEERDAKRQTRQQQTEYQDGASSISKRRRAQAAAFYPDVVRKIDPGVWGAMSAADVDTFLKEAAPTRAGGGKGGGLSAAQMNALRNKMPAHLVDTYNALGRVKAQVDEMGGWENTKTGVMGGMVPNVFMDKRNQALRQELGGVMARFLQAGGGKSITSNEERILIGNIAADPTSFRITPSMLQRGVSIMERSQAADTRQALAGAPEEAKDALLGDMKIPRQWVDQDLQGPQQTTRKRKIAKGPNGQRRYINPDGSLGDEVR